jgi:hydrogenase expression/formation protein HypE
MANEKTDIYNGMTCPLSISDYKKVLLAHGGGGNLSHQLIQKMFLSQFSNSYLDEEHDGAVIPVKEGRIAFSTDSYVVHPIFFPGGNIGELAVNGTVNDLSMCGAKPAFISAGFIIEEGLPMEELWQIVLSMKMAAEAAGVRIVTGDTKVVDKGKGDKIFINTSGIGFIEPGVDISPKNCSTGDVIILNGRIGDHGVAIMSAREGLSFETQIVSDTAPLNSLVEVMLNTSRNIHVLRDPTRGGLASALNEIAITSGKSIIIEENSIPIAEEVKGACEILGFDPLYIANEGKLVAFVAEADAEKVLSAMRSHQSGKESVIIGRVTSGNPGTVVMKTLIGTNRIVDMLSGEQLPRIC